MKHKKNNDVATLVNITIDKKISDNVKSGDIIEIKESAIGRPRTAGLPKHIFFLVLEDSVGLLSIKTKALLLTTQEIVYIKIKNSNQTNLKQQTCFCYFKNNPDMDDYHSGYTGELTWHKR